MTPATNNGNVSRSMRHSQYNVDIRGGSSTRQLIAVATMRDADDAVDVAVVDVRFPRARRADREHQARGHQRHKAEVRERESTPIPAAGSTARPSS